MLVSLYFALLMVICMVDSEGDDSSDNVVFITNMFSLNESIDVEKLHSALQDQGLTHVEFLILDYGSPSSFKTLSRGKRWNVWLVTCKDLLQWLSDRKPKTLISFTDNIDIPQILISAQRKGLLPLTEIVIWITESKSLPRTSGAVNARITSTVLGDFYSQQGTINAPRDVNFIFKENVESLVVDVLQTEYHKRVKRATGQSSANPLPTTEMVPFKSETEASPAGPSPFSAMVDKSSTVTAPPASPSESSADVASHFSATVGPVISLHSSVAVTGASSAALFPPASQSPLTNVFLSHSKAVTSSSSFNPSSLGVVARTSSVVVTFPVSQSSSSAIRSSTPGSAPVFARSSLSSAVVATSSAVAAPSAGHSASNVMMGTSTVQILPRSTSPSSTVVSGSSAVISSPGSQFSSSGEPASSSAVVAPPVRPSQSVAMVGTSSTLFRPPARPSLSSTVAGTSSIWTVVASPSLTSTVADTAFASTVRLVRSPSSWALVTVSSSAVAPPARLSPSITVVSTPSAATAPTTTSSLFSNVVTSLVSSSSFTSAGVSNSAETLNNVTSVFTSSSAVGISTKIVSAFTESSTSIPIPSVSKFVSSFTVLSSRKPLVSSQAAVTLLTTSSISVVEPHVSRSTLAVQSTSVSSYTSPWSIFSFSSVSIEKTSTASSSQTSTLPRSPSSSSFLPQSSSLVRSTTSMTLAPSVVTSVSAGLSTTVMSSSWKNSQSTSPSPTVNTEPPPVYENKTMKIEFDGNCEDVRNANEETQFKVAFVNEISKKLRIRKSSIKVISIDCGSIVVIFNFAASGKVNISQTLRQLVESGNITVKVLGKTFTAIRIKVVSPTTSAPPVATTNAPKKNIKVILYIAFGALAGIALIVGISVWVLRCRNGRRGGNFFLTDEANYELRGFPRARNYAKADYYGEPVELDATVADPNASDEFQPQEGDYQYNQGSSLDRVKPIAAANNDDKFNVGAMGLPEWKNLPKLAKSEVAVTSALKHGISKSSGSVGSRTQLLPDESPSSDNFGVTFGDGASGLKKEDLDYAYDNPVATEEDGPLTPEDT